MKKIKGFLATLFLICFLVPSAAWALTPGPAVLDISPGTGINAGGGASIVVPINISGVGAGIAADAIGFTINFDPDVLTFGSVDKTGTLLEPFSLVSGQVNAPGVAKISGSLFGTTVNITSSGVLLNVNFTVNATAFKNSSLALTEFKDDIATATTSDANFTITGVTVAVNLTANPTVDVIAGQPVQFTAEVTVNDTPLDLTSTDDVDISGNGNGTFGTKSIVGGKVVVDYTSAALVENATITATETLTGNDNEDTATVKSIPGPATQLLKDSGDNQNEIVASTLTPFIVQLRDANNNPIEGETITFTGGSLSAASDTTDGNGKASTTLTLSETAGSNSVTAAYDTLSATFTATGTPDAPFAFEKEDGDAQTATAGTALPDSFVVSIADQYGNAISGLTVTFAVASGGGSLSALTPTTNAQGQAGTTLTLGTVSGSDNNTVTASATGLDDLTFSASANPDAASSFTIVSGNSQSGTVDKDLSAFVVKVADQYNNPISGVDVSFAVTAGSGSLSAATDATGTDGEAETILTLGTVSGTNNNTVTASASGLTTLTFTASAVPDSANKIVLVSDKTKIASDGKGEAQLTATLYDQFDNKVTDTGTAITFTVTGDGVANAGWTSESASTTAGVATKTFTTTGLVPEPGTTSVTIKAANQDLGANDEDSVVVEIVNFSATAEYSNLATSGTLHSTDITAVGATNYTWSIVSGPGSLSANSGTTITFTAATTVTNGTAGDETKIKVEDAADSTVAYELTLKTYTTVQVTAPAQAVGLTFEGDTTTYQITVTGGSGDYEYRVSNDDGTVPMGQVEPISVSDTGLVTGLSLGTRKVYVWDSALGSLGSDDSFRDATADIEVVNKIVVEPPSESIQASGTQQYQASGGSGTYTWGVEPVSAGSISSAGLFTAAAVTENMTDVVIKATDAAYTNIMATVDAAVYSKVEITNKPDVPPVIAPGEDSDAFTVASGDGTAYTWSVAGPVDVEGGTGTSFIFQAPDSGAFAGEYTVTVTDGQGFTDSFTVQVPMVLDPNNYNVMEESQLEITIAGASESAGFTFTAYDVDGNEVVFSQPGGDVTGWGQMTLDGNVLTYVADDIALEDEIAFTLEVISNDADLIDLDLDLIDSGIYRVIPYGIYAGVVKDADTGAPIEGAIVRLLAPNFYGKNFQNDKVALIDSQARYTDADGSFEFELAATGATYQFQVTYSGYVTKTFTSNDLAKSSDVLITSAAATPLIISGDVIPYEEGTVVSLIIDGDLAGIRTTDFQGYYRFEFETDPGADTYLLSATNGSAYNEVSVSGALPISVPDIDLTEGAAGTIRLIVDGDIDYEKTDDIYGSDRLVSITAQDSTGNPIADPQFPNGLVLTLPFNLGQVAPGAFESGDVAIYHAGDTIELLAGNGSMVPVSDILIVDYIGDGQTGSVTFRVYSLSVFGIGTGSGTSALRDNSDDSVCFISSVAGNAGFTLPGAVLGMAGLLVALLHWTGRKSNR